VPSQRKSFYQKVETVAMIDGIDVDPAKWGKKRKTCRAKGKFLMMACRESSEAKPGVHFLVAESAVPSMT